LCDDARKYVSRLNARGYDLSVEERDITADPALFERFRHAIPVLEFPDGRTLRAPISEYKLEKLLNGAG